MKNNPRNTLPCVRLWVIKYYIWEAFRVVGERRS